MFNFLKDKLKSAVSLFSKAVKKETEAEEKVIERPVEKKPEKPVKEPVSEKEVEPKEKFPAKKEEKIISEQKKETTQETARIEKEVPEKIVEKVIVPVLEKEIERIEEKIVEIAEPVQETKIPEQVEVPEVKPEKKSFFKKLFSKPKEEKAAVPELKKEVEAQETERIEERVPEVIVKKIPEAEPEEQGFFAKVKETITKKTLTDDKFNELFNDFEMMMLENNVAFEVIEKIKLDLKKELVDTKVFRGQLEDTIQETLKKSVNELFDVEGFDLMEKIKSSKDRPYVIVFVGINGTGKTTTIAKIVHMLKKHKLTSCIAAADTFRAAAIQQLEEHANKLNVKMIKHDYGSDPAAVAFDAIHYAKAHGLDVVLIDTAGRLHSNTNLMDELKKVIRVTKPNLKIYVGDSLTGNDCVEQGTEFNSAVTIDAIILAKSDVDEKGGAALSISYVTKKPIIYLGIGQGYEDIETFDKNKILQRIGLA
jgi:fused signal recognition particle receptor